MLQEMQRVQLILAQMLLLRHNDCLDLLCCRLLLLKEVVNCRNSQQRPKCISVDIWYAQFYELHEWHWLV